MQVHIENISPVKKKINIEIPAEQIDLEIEKFYVSVQKEAKLQGFRPGKAPMQLVKRIYSDSMPDRVQLRIYEQTLDKILDEHKIESIDSPVIESDILEQGKPFKFSVLVEVMPEIHLQEYTGLVVKKEKYVASHESIESELRRMQEKMAQLTSLDYSAKVENGNVVTVDYSFTVDGFPEESGNAVNDVVDVGAGRHISGFEEQLIGMKRGESKEIRVTLPEGYRYSRVDGKEATFQVILKEIKRKELPELDDEFAQQSGEYESMQQLRAKIEENYEKQEELRINNELKDRLIHALIGKNPLDVPESMVKRQLDYMLENWKQSQQIPTEMLNVDDDGLRDHFQNTATDRVRARLLLLALVEKENITVEDDDIEKRYEEIAANNSDTLDSVREHFKWNLPAKNAMIDEIKAGKAVNFLLDHAVITEVDASELK